MMRKGLTPVVRGVWRVLRNILPFGFLLLLAAAITGCDSAEERAKAEAIRIEAHTQAMATQQALDIEATATAIETYEDLETRPERIQNRKTREWWLNLILIGLLTSLAVLGVVWAAAEIKARTTRALNAAQSYRPDPRTGTLPVVRVDHVPGRAARLAHEVAPLIRIFKPDYLPAPLQYMTTLTDLDAGTQVRILRVVDSQGRLHVWQETHLAPPGQQALVHHTRRVVTTANAVAGMNQRHAAAGEIAQAVPQVGHMPAFEPSYRSTVDDATLIQLDSRQYHEWQAGSGNGRRSSQAEEA
jgi:hypothetical protein